MTEGPGLAGRKAKERSPFQGIVLRGPGQEGQLCRPAWASYIPSHDRASSIAQNPFSTKPVLHFQSWAPHALNDCKGLKVDRPKKQKAESGEPEPMGRQPGALAAGADVQAAPWT